MIGRLAAGVVALGALAATLACFSDRSATGPSADACPARLDPDQFGSVIIAIEGFAFRQSPVQVRVGDRVTWVNCEPAGTPAHTTTADGSAWGSSLLDPGASYTVSFPSAGTFTYHCEPHPSMTAEIIVEP